ncbi:hypothetical protein bcgnr5372_27410 [Bacillus luti]|nr:hypothetical protein [Bacillus cereus]HDR8330575.1 hypothetical protein [Bacillus cereus]HDR8338023.1 hypothetical protein [Bacillus cereus]
MATIYLAGKIAKNDWRHSIFKGLRSYRYFTDDMYVRNRDFNDIGELKTDGFIYKGPYFISDDHGLAHGPNSHGRGIGKYSGYATPMVPDIPSQPKKKVLKMCLKGIDDSDFVFCWLDSATAYGTICELGYALANGKYIVIALEKDFKIVEDTVRDILPYANQIIYADSAEEAWDEFTNKETREGFSYLPSIRDYYAITIMHDAVQRFCYSKVHDMLLESPLEVEFKVNRLYRYGLVEEFLKQHENLTPFIKGYTVNIKEFENELLLLMDYELVQLAMTEIYEEETDIKDTNLKYFIYENANGEGQNYLFRGEAQCSNEQRIYIENLLVKLNLKVRDEYSLLNINKSEAGEIIKFLTDKAMMPSSFGFLVAKAN